MTQLHPTPAPQAGPELDYEVAALLGVHPIRLGPVSTDPGAAFRALELWRAVGKWRCWDVRSPKAHWPAQVDLWDEGPVGYPVRRANAEAATPELAAALALRAALGGKG